MKSLKKKVCCSILFVILTLFISGIMPYSNLDYYLSANTVDTSDAALKAIEDQLAKIQQALKDNQAKLDSAEKDLLNEMQTKKLLDENLELTRQSIDKQNEQLIEIKNSIDQKTYEIDQLEQNIDEQYEVFLQIMRISYEEGNVNLLEVILGSTSLPEFIMNIEYAGSLLNYQQSIMQELNVESEALRINKEELNEKQQIALEVEASLKLAEKDLEEKAEKSANYINYHRANISNTEADISQSEADLEKASQEFEAIIVERERQKALKNEQTYYTGSGTLAWPASASNNRVSSGYGNRYYNGKTEFHRGLDIPVNFGDPVYAAAAGKVVQATYHSSYGNYVMIDHGLREDGSSLYTLYAHNSSLTVKVGDYVEVGQQIAKGGATGYASGNHIHFEVRINGATVDPAGFVSAP